MNLLLVDDEEYVIESIKKHLDFEKLGINAVYTASSMKQAQTIMDLQPMQLVVSDIVMPQGSGFDFMGWVRREGYEAQVIFLTSYAEFDYAKRAIDLNSVDYLLKPIDFEKLGQAIEKAAARVREVEQAEAYRAESEKWNQNKHLLQKNFWMELLYGSLEGERLFEEVKKRRLDYRPDAVFLPAVLYMDDRRPEGYESLDSDILGFIIGNVLEEMAEGYGMQIASVVSRRTGHYAVVLHVLEKEEEEKVQREGGDFKYRTEGFHEDALFPSFIKWMEEKVPINIWCGVGSFVELQELKEAQKRIQNMRENSLSVWNRALYLDDFEQPQFAYQNPNLPVWEALLKEQKVQEITESMKRYLKEIDESEMITRDILKKFRVDVTQMVYTWLAGQEIKAHLLFSGRESEELYQGALESLEGAVCFAGHLVKKAVEYQKYVGHTGSVADQLKQYMDRHYQEDIRRDSLAAQVYLNTDYMSRIFKREMGISISAYLIQKRVGEAKKLLTESDLPINTVSLYVGYSNFSYFTRMFRENTGNSPLEYRRKYRKPAGLAPTSGQN